MLFLITVFVSAFLLFQVQPFIAKVILPYYGGSATVWTSCMLFFQLLLLAGYSYAHVLQKLSFQRQWQVHVALLIIASIVLPFTTPIPDITGISSNPMVSILLTLTLAIGLPYFTLSATGPLVQRWLTLSNENKVPYKLYSLSNVGSLLALISYPFLFEPVLTLHQQTLFWSLGFICFAVIITTLALSIKKDIKHTNDQSSLALNKTSPVTLSLWLLLSALGVMLLVSTTNAMTQNVAPMPFLWVLPLALYLVSFIIAFHSPKWYVRWYWLAFFMISALMAIMLPAVGSHFDFTSQVLMYSFILFAGCMICHAELMKHAPAANKLTLFYLVIALGGVLGSALVSIVAPLVFDSFSEYPIAIIATLVLFILSLTVSYQGKTRIGMLPKAWALSLLGLAVIGLTALQLQLDKQLAQHQVASKRNFYGLLAVVDTKTNGKPERRLIDGTTSHGTQALTPALATQAKSYYRANTGVALALENYQPLTRALSPIKVGLIGLGAGTLATYGQPGENYHFYELNPAVVDYAKQYFSYLDDSKANISIHIGDGRLLLQQALADNGSEQFDILVLDAFSGDAIPAHLLTLEAMQLYQAHLKEKGVLAIHISNSHLDLTNLTRNLAQAIGLDSRYFYTASTADEPNASQWVLMTNDQSLLRRYKVKKHISPWPKHDNSELIWTDNYSNLLSVLK